MIIELYSAPAAGSSQAVESPISNTTGELPDQEPTLDPDDLLGSFDSREDAVASIEKQLSDQNQAVTDRLIVPFNAYTHIELLTITIRNQDLSSGTKSYYLVSDEGY